MHITTTEKYVFAAKDQMVVQYNPDLQQVNQLTLETFRPQALTNDNLHANQSRLAISHQEGTNLYDHHFNLLWSIPNSGLVRLTKDRLFIFEPLLTSIFDLQGNLLYSMEDQHAPAALLKVSTTQNTLAYFGNLYPHTLKVFQEDLSVQTIDLPDQFPTALAISPDTQWLAVASVDPDGNHKIRMYRQPPKVAGSLGNLGEGPNQTPLVCLEYDCPTVVNTLAIVADPKPTLYAIKYDQDVEVTSFNLQSHFNLWALHPRQVHPLKASGHRSYQVPSNAQFDSGSLIVYTFEQDRLTNSVLLPSLL